MNQQAEKKFENASQRTDDQRGRESGFVPSTPSFTDNRPTAALQRMLQNTVHTGLRSQHTAQRQSVIQKKENKTGLPDNLKSGIESLSGMSMDHVKVHYNSDRPAQLQAHAYAQGSDIHVAPGQEQHLPHEAWHVVQQAQGRVRQTAQLKSGVAINDDLGLEHEADLMGQLATKINGGVIVQQYQSSHPYIGGTVQCMLIRRQDPFPAVSTNFTPGNSVFPSPPHAYINAEVPIDEEEKNDINLYLGQNYLNDQLSMAYYNGGAIRSEKARIAWDGDGTEAQIIDGHHRLVWGLYRGNDVEFQRVEASVNGVPLAEVKYQGTPVVKPVGEEKKEDAATTLSTVPGKVGEVD
ncbi:eCIS core domain-containing protein [Herbaspirillum camelliae]|uniref:eCIS core domain-containing protein n=1 Tax=Herbaspirillum camelliae TaxID=1892903 RepID=UPI000B01C7E9|nr:DUF4157 domain-containing protein [Herbaspirillum camelliae]